MDHRLLPKQITIWPRITQKSLFSHLQNTILMRDSCKNTGSGVMETSFQILSGFLKPSADPRYRGRRSSQQSRDYQSFSDRRVSSGNLQSTLENDPPRQSQPRQSQSRNERVGTPSKFYQSGSRMSQSSFKSVITKREIGTQVTPKRMARLSNLSHRFSATSKYGLYYIAWNSWYLNRMLPWYKWPIDTNMGNTTSRQWIYTEYSQWSKIRAMVSNWSIRYIIGYIIAAIKHISYAA